MTPLFALSRVNVEAITQFDLPTLAGSLFFFPCVNVKFGEQGYREIQDSLFIPSRSRALAWLEMT